MSIQTVGSIRLPKLSVAKPGLGLAKQLFLKVLERARHGHLEIIDGDDHLTFGQATSDTDIRAYITVHDRQLYQDLLVGGSIAAGETYIRQYWSSPNLTEVMRFFSANMAVLEGLQQKKSLLLSGALRLHHYFNRNTQTGSRRNISAHYDLGNEFFRLFLDPSMMYSSAVYPSNAATLAEASEYKLRLICEQLELSPQDHLIEIGSGWGGMAVFAASTYGCRVTTTTISKEQYRLTRERVKAAGLEEQVTVLCEDYRDLTGTYDKLVSIEMIEAVGHHFFANYFAKVSSLLKPHGKAVIQAITIPDNRFHSYKRSVDFIKRYIFPGGCLPSINQISHHVARETDMELVHLRDITLDYARTLSDWRDAFMANFEKIREMGFDGEFKRLWEYYLCYCEGGFRERIIGTVQVTFAKPGYRIKE